MAAPEGSYRPAARDLILELRGATTPARVSIAGRELARIAADAASGTGWSEDDAGVVRVRLPDRFEAAAIDLTF